MRIVLSSIYLFLILFIAPGIKASEGTDLFSLSLKELLNAKVQVASGYKEELARTPVPVSIITQQMIENSGVSTIRDLLTLYIPGFTQVQDQNEYNVAFRGIYTSSQQKFLILLNNHRLNSRAYSMANPDHSIALEKVKRIEILRGPGSPIYGNVALTSVVNIVTKSGKEANGFSSSIEIGNHGYEEFYAQYGKQTDTLDYFSWFKYVKNDGETHTIRPQDDYSPTPHGFPVTSYLDGFRDDEPFDVGMMLDFTNEWSVLINYRRGHYLKPLTLSGQAFTQSEYSAVNGVEPGTQSTSWHVNVKKQWELDAKNNIYASIFYDANHIQGPVVLEPTLGSFSDIAWKDYDYGVKSKWLHHLENGVFVAGVELDKMKVWDSELITGSNGLITGPVLINGEPVLLLGEESVSSFYLQHKQSINENWLSNTSFRYDAKKRRTGEKINELSPRVALIYNKSGNTLKFSYSRAFVDPPYWNRYAQLDSFRGSVDLKPEILQSFQITPEFSFSENQLYLKLNLFYNKYKDVVFRKNDAAANEPFYNNTGKLESIGLELEWTYYIGDTTYRFNGSFYDVKSVERYTARNDEIFNIPQHQYNLIMDSSYSENISYQLALKYMGSRLSPINITGDIFPGEGVEFPLPNNRLDSVYLFNANMRWQLPDTGLTFTFNVQNLFDKEWEQGGSTLIPYRQTGRWFKLGMEYNL